MANCDHGGDEGEYGAVAERGVGEGEVPTMVN